MYRHCNLALVEKAGCGTSPGRSLKIKAFLVLVPGDCSARSSESVPALADPCCPHTPQNGPYLAERKNLFLLPLSCARSHVTLSFTNNDIFSLLLLCPSIEMKSQVQICFCCHSKWSQKSYSGNHLHSALYLNKFERTGFWMQLILQGTQGL